MEEGSPLFRPPAAGTDLGGFVVVRDLGQGGMGTVVVARDLALDREVAVKFLHDGRPGDEQFIARVHREGRALARVDHSNVVRVHSVGKWEGWPFLVMELVRGESLSDLLARGPLPLDGALRVAEELAAALAAVHAQRITHRDVKPLNCVLRDADGSLCLIDFGLARAAGTSMRSSSGGGGTIDFAAPEQISGGHVDARADVYGFGATIHVALTGRRTHEADEPAALFHAILHEDVPLLRTVLPGAPRDLEVLLARCLARAPAFRPANGGALLPLVRAVRGSGKPAAEFRVAEEGPAVSEAPLDPSEAYPLLGRGEEYRAALEALGEAAVGRGALLLVEGEPGAGKTRFLREVERAARAQGMEILRCECSEYAGAPHRALRSMLTAAGAARGATTVDGLVSLAAGDGPPDPLLSSALRWLLDPGPGKTGSIPARSLIVHAVQGLFRAILADRPALMVADDLNFLDEGSLDMLTAVLAESPSWPLASALSFRPAEEARGGAALASRLPGLGALRGSRRIALGPLSEAAVASMICSALGVSDDEACRLAPALHRRAAGNPMFVVECLRMLEQEQSSDRGAASVPASRRLSRLAIPPRLMELAVQRIGRLPRDEREALGVVSVDPAGLPAAVVAKCLDLPLRGALRVLQELVRTHGLLHCAGDRYGVVSAGIREAAYADLLPELLMAYHEEAALALAAAGAASSDPAALGRHLRLAGKGAEAVGPLVEAGRRLLHWGSVQDALERFDEALACAGSGGSVPASLGRAEALARSGDAEGARVVLHAVAAGKEARVEALLRLALLERDRGRNQEALGFLATAEPLPRTPEESIRLLIYRAQFLSRLLRFEEALVSLEAAGGLVPSASPDSRLRLSFTRGSVLWRLGRFEEAREQWEATLPLVEAAGDLDMATRLLHNLSLVCTDLRRWEDALAWAERGMERARLLALPPSLILARLQLVDVLLRIGRLDEAEAALTSAEADVERIESGHRATAANCRCRVELARGRPLAALDRAETGAARERPGGRDWADLRLMAAHALLRLGRNEESLRAAREAGRVMAALGVPEEAEDAVAVAANALRAAGIDGEERTRMRNLGAARTTMGALESAAESADPAVRARLLEEARRLVRNEVDRAAVEGSSSSNP